MSPSDGASIMLSAGEASGDLHGSTLCRALSALCPGVSLFGMGGPRMGAAGVSLIADPTRHAAVGTSDAIGRIPNLLRTFRALSAELAARRPRALVVIDFPEFNLRLARRARRAGVPVVYFIPPQLWAWRGGRIRQVARRISRVLAVLPFEPALYERAGVAVDFVGHPLLDVLPLDLARDDARRAVGVDPGEVLVGLLPGSRREEIARLLPAMAGAAARLAALGAARRFALGLAPTVERGEVERILREAGAPPVDVLAGRTWELMAAADALVTASGTATLEAALLGAPMVVCYRASRITEVIVRLLVNVEWCSLPNLVANRAAVPELLQDDVTADRIAAEVERLLRDPVAAAAQRAAFKEVRAQLGEPGVGRRAAAAVLETAGLA